MFFVYILKAKSKDWFYVGQTKDYVNRLKIHNLGNNKSTKAYRPFEIVYLEEFETRKEAFMRERQIKKYKHGDAFKKLVS